MTRPTPVADSLVRDTGEREAQTMTDRQAALLDSQYRAGAKAGWNAQFADDPEATIAALIKVEPGALAALAPAALAVPDMVLVPREPTEAQIKDATTEYLSYRGERPYRVLRGGQELWEAHMPAMRAAFRAAALASQPVPVASDLIARLRNTYAAWNNPPSDGLPEGAGIVLEAADHIAALEAEIARWHENWDANVQDMSEKFRAVNIARVIAATGDDILALRDRAMAAEARVADLESLSASNEALRAALERDIFAKAFRWLSKWPEYKPNPDREAEYEADFAAARALIKPDAGKEKAG